MINYQIGNYTITTDLTRYSKRVGEDGNYTLGYCVVEFLETANKIYSAEPRFVDGNKPYELLDVERGTGLNGRMAIQEDPQHFNASEEDKNKWLAKKRIDAPNGDVNALILANLEEKKRPNNSEEYDKEYNRLLVAANTPKNATPATVAALIRHNSEVASQMLQKRRVEQLASDVDISIPLAQALAACDIDGSIVYRNDGWHTPKALFVAPPSRRELDSLVEKGLMNFEKETYTVTSKGSQAVQDRYL